MAEAPGWWRRAGRRARQDTHALARLLASRRERRAMAEGLRAPHNLRRRHRRALVLLALLAALGTWLAGSAALRLWAPGHASAWDLAWFLGIVAFLTTVVLPVSYEPALFAARDASGVPVAILAASVGITLGALVVWFIGGAARHQLEAWKGRSPFLAKFLERTERFARRWEYLALGAMTAVPLFPDTLPVYVFSVLDLRLRPFLAAVFAGSLLRSTAVVLLGQHLGLIPS